MFGKKSDPKEEYQNSVLFFVTELRDSDTGMAEHDIVLTHSDPSKSDISIACDDLNKKSAPYVKISYDDILCVILDHDFHVALDLENLWPDDDAFDLHAFDRVIQMDRVSKKARHIPFDFLKEKMRDIDQFAGLSQYIDEETVERLREPVGSWVHKINVRQDFFDLSTNFAECYVGSDNMALPSQIFDTHDPVVSVVRGSLHVNFINSNVVPDRMKPVLDECSVELTKNRSVSIPNPGFLRGVFSNYMIQSEGHVSAVHVLGDVKGADSLMIGRRSGLEINPDGIEGYPYVIEHESRMAGKIDFHFWGDDVSAYEVHKVRNDQRGHASKTFQIDSSKVAGHMVYISSVDNEVLYLDSLQPEVRESGAEPV